MKDSGSVALAGILAKLVFPCGLVRDGDWAMLNMKAMRFSLEIILLCIRWYAAYALSYRNLEKMMQERGVFVDHSTLNRWAIKFLPMLEKVFRKHKCPVRRSWRMDETYIKVGGEWKYLYRAVGKEGATVDFLLCAK